MSDENNEIRLPESEPPGKEPPHSAPQQYPVPEENGGCFAIVGKIILVLAIGIFVLMGLVFATCFLGRR
jgi:hypothetical protein